MDRKRKTNKTRKFSSKILYCFFAFFIISVVIGLLSSSKKEKSVADNASSVENEYNIGSDKNDSFLLSSYTLKELLELNGHPRVFDNFDDAEKFYSDILDSRIQITDTQTFSTKQMRQHNRFDDKVALYLIQSSSGKKNTIGYIHLNIFDKNLTSLIVLEDVIQLVVDYLPVDFQHFYKLDSAYTTTGEDLVTYTYACRLTESGLTESVDLGKNYAPYYNFKLYHYLDNNCWCIETGYEAYGGHSLDWIQKYSEPWDIDLASYFEE